MASLDDIVKMDGVVFACEFTSDGKCKDYKAKMEVPGQMPNKAAEYAAMITMLFNALADSFTQISGMQWVPQRVWMYTGGDWTAVVGGNKAVITETAKTDVNKVAMALAGAEEKVMRQSM